MDHVRSPYNSRDVDKKISSLASFSISWGKEEAPSRQKWNAYALYIGSDVRSYVSRS